MSRELEAFSPFVISKWETIGWKVKEGGVYGTRIGHATNPLMMVCASQPASRISIEISSFYRPKLSALLK